MEQRIENAALRVFSETGFHRVALTEIAREAGAVRDALGGDVRECSLLASAELLCSAITGDSRVCRSARHFR